MTDKFVPTIITVGEFAHKIWTLHIYRLPWLQGEGTRVVVSTAAFHARVRGSVPGLGGLKETKLFLPHPRVKVSIVGSLCDREVACSASDRQGSNFESCVWRTVSSQSSQHPQEVLLAQFSLYVHKGGLPWLQSWFKCCWTVVLAGVLFVYVYAGWIKLKKLIYCLTFDPLNLHILWGLFVAPL